MTLSNWIQTQTPDELYGVEAAFFVSWYSTKLLIVFLPEVRSWIVLLRRVLISVQPHRYLKTSSFSCSINVFTTADANYVFFFPRLAWQTLVCVSLQMFYKQAKKTNQCCTILWGLDEESLALSRPFIICFVCLNPWLYRMNVVSTLVLHSPWNSINIFTVVCICFFICS